MNSLLQQKQIIRKRVDTGLPAAGKRFADIQITKSLMSLKIYRNAKSICSYVSTSNEVDTHQIIRETLLAKGSIIVPKIQGMNLELYGTYGILEPHIRRAHVPIQSIDLFIVPGIAFGKNGSRIGHGKGYYDRLLQSISVPIIALAYNQQVFDTIPHGAKDKKVDIIITESHIYDLKKPSSPSV